MLTPSIKLVLDRNKKPAETEVVSASEMEDILRRNTTDFAKLIVTSVGSLMTLKTALNILEHHATK